jgi:integrase
MVFSIALGTGLRLGELVGLNVGDVYFPDGRVKARIRLPAEIAKARRPARSNAWLARFSRINFGQIHDAREGSPA